MARSWSIWCAHSERRRALTNTRAFAGEPARGSSCTRRAVMRILWVKAGKLLPVDTGGKIRSYNLLRQLARRHELTLLSYYGGSRDGAYEGAVQQHFPGAAPLAAGVPDASAWHYAANLLSSAPYAVTKFT